MKICIFNVLQNLIKIPRYQRRLILVFGDGLLISISLFFFHNQLFSSQQESNFINIWQYFIIILLTLILFIYTGQYKSLTKYQSSEIIYNQFFKNLIFVIVIFLVQIFSTLSLISSFISLLLFSIIYNFISTTIRFIMRDLLLNVNKESLINVVIYGAGQAGAELAASLKFNGKHNIKFFLDDNNELWGRTLYGFKIYDPDFLKKSKVNVDQILLAIPSLNKDRRKQILVNLGSFDLPVLQIPSIDQLTSGKDRIDTLIPIEITELLGRKQSYSNNKFIVENYTNKIICITGAAGSIGSGLCEQLLKLDLKTLICLDMSEKGLYELKNLLDKLNYKNITIKLILGSATNKKLIYDIFLKYNVEIVFHAAAYKHVPLVELNPIQGLSNNFSSTLNICRAALNFNIEKVVLISSDKAVRPTNVMGASKRLAEIVLHYYQKKTNNKKNNANYTCFTMVRFGNVLDSSGSVVPLFKKQIKEGGPVTITHENIYRYFMTIPEATSLVLHSAVLARGGDLFLLDMGNPVRIRDLAEKMIRLSGLTIKSKDNVNGDIEIINTGLRPGEKLYEELLIKKDSSERTNHPFIFKAKEGINYSFSSLEQELENLEKFLLDQNTKMALAKLKELVPEWNTTLNFNE